MNVNDSDARLARHCKKWPSWQTDLGDGIVVWPREMFLFAYGAGEDERWVHPQFLAAIFDIYRKTRKCRCGRTQKHHWVKGRRFCVECEYCGHQEYLLGRTIMGGSHVELYVWFYVTYLLLKTDGEITVSQIEGLAGVTRKTAWRMRDRLSWVSERWGMYKPQEFCYYAVVVSSLAYLDYIFTQQYRVPTSESRLGVDPRFHAVQRWLLAELSTIYESVLAESKKERGHWIVDYYEAFKRFRRLWQEIGSCDRADDVTTINNEKEPLRKRRGKRQPKG